MSVGVAGFVHNASLFTAGHCRSVHLMWNVLEGQTGLGSFIKEVVGFCKVICVMGLHGVLCSLQQFTLTLK